MERFFYDASARRHSIALKLHWFLQAAEGDDVANQRLQVERLMTDLDTIIVNGQNPVKLPSLEVPLRLIAIDDIPEDEAEVCNRKTIRAEFYGFQQKFGTTLCKLSIALTPQPEELRLKILQTCISNVNNWLEDTRHRFHASNSHSM
jgi:hypothetical protein